MPLIVTPRFYERTTVQATAGLVLLVAVAFGVWRAERSRSRMRLERLRMQTAMEQERQRIARDIHDDLGAGLTEIILLSDNLHDELPPLPGSDRMVNEISVRARALTRAMDEVVWAVNPRNDTLEGLLTYFNKFAQEYLSHAGMRCRMDVPVELPYISLAAETRHHLYLACKEALNNCVKHSGGSEVWIHLKPALGHYVLSIEDNGHGFNMGNVARGNGLQNMRRRLEELGGRCEIHSTPDRGTRVDLFIVIDKTTATNGTKNGKHRA
jgi:signal transduction histidine kinase